MMKNIYYDFSKSFIGGFKDKKELMDIKTYLELQTILSNKNNNELQTEYLHGYLTAVLCSPKIILPSSWLKIIIGDTGEIMNFSSMEESQIFMSLLMQMYNDINNSLADKTFTPLFSLTENVITPEFTETWCQGFILGLNLWDRSFSDDETTKLLITPILILARDDLFLDLIENDLGKSIDEKTLNDIKIEAFQNLTGFVIKLRQINVSNPNIESVKTGRNEPCPCGSGKKYKQCCGNNS